MRLEWAGLWKKVGSTTCVFKDKHETLRKCASAGVGVGPHPPDGALAGVRVHPDNTDMRGVRELQNGEGRPVGLTLIPRMRCISLSPALNDYPHERKEVGSTGRRARRSRR